MGMFPSLSEDTITAVLEAQGGDADKACDELLNMAVGDDLFNRSIYIEDNLSASQNLQRFDRKEEDELRRKQKQEQILAERRAKQEAAKREEEARLKEEAKRKEEQRILAERKAKQEELKKQERE